MDFVKYWWCGVLLMSGAHELVAEPGTPFVENKNQWPAQFLFAADFPGHKVFLTKKGFYIANFSDQRVEKGSPGRWVEYQESGHAHANRKSVSTFEILFLGKNTTALQVGNALPTRYSYFVGNDRSKWGMGAASYDAVEYENVYEGIDLRVYSEGHRFKYDWILQPCADPRQIQLRYNGLDAMCLQDENLVLSSPAGELSEMKPIAWQEINGTRKYVKVNYHLVNHEISYDFPDGYDTNYELVIDPILIFSGYSGSTYDNWGNTATYDSEGNLYSGGIVTTEQGGHDFPITAGSYQTNFGGGEWDIAILKYDSSGANLLYATYLGGEGTETPQSLVVNSKNELLILGATSSGDFPVTNNSDLKGGGPIDPLHGIDYSDGTDLFIAKLSTDGSSLLSATFLGGSANDGVNFISGSMGTNNKQESPLAKNYGDQLRGDIVTDDNDNVLIASTTLSTDFPIINTNASVSFNGGNLDAVVAKLSPDLSTLLWTRLLGGSKDEAAYSVKIGDDNSVYVAGGTTSANFKGLNGFHADNAGGVDGWIAQLSEDGAQILNGTYLGTAAYDQSYFIDLTSTGEVMAFGQTQGAYPVSSQIYTNEKSGQFLHKLSADLHTSLFSTVIGSGVQSPNISPTAFLVSDCNTIYLSGWGGGINGPTGVGEDGTTIVNRSYVGGSTVGLPVTADAYKKTTSGNDFYFMVLSGDASQLLYATFLGGNISPTHVDGGTSRFDKKGIVYHAVCAGCGGTSDFPAVNVPESRKYNRSNGRCNNAAFKFDLALLKAHIQTNSVNLKKPGIKEVCLTDTLVYQNKSTGGKIFEWDFGDGTKMVRLDTTRLLHVYKVPGTYTVKLKAVDSGTCVGKDSTYLVVRVNTITAEVMDDATICANSSIRLLASGGTDYAWREDKGSFTSNEPGPLITPTDTTVYFVTIKNARGCIVKDTVTINVVPAIDLNYSFEKLYDCASRALLQVRNLTEDGDEEFYFDFGDGTTSESKEETHAYDKDGVYSVKLYGKREFCMFSKEENISIVSVLAPNVITPIDQDNNNDSFRLIIGNATNQLQVNVSLKIYNRWGGLVFESKDYKGEWRGEGVNAGVYYYEAEVEGETTCKSWVHVIK